LAPARLLKLCIAGSGWCPYSDIFLAIRKVRQASQGRIRHVLIIDTDVHQGNGHARDKMHFSDQDVTIVDLYNAGVLPLTRGDGALEGMQPTRHCCKLHFGHTCMRFALYMKQQGLSLQVPPLLSSWLVKVARHAFADIWPGDAVAKRAIDVERALHTGCADEEYLAALSSALDEAFQKCQPHLVIHNAGTDILIGDPLGKYASRCLWSALSADGATMSSLQAAPAMPRMHAPAGGGLLIKQFARATPARPLANSPHRNVISFRPACTW
jgi:Histone deacetylase domain